MQARPGLRSVASSRRQVSGTSSSRRAEWEKPGAADWDSFCLVTPNWSVQLPGQGYDGKDPDGFMPRDEVVAYLKRYAAGFEAPVREGVAVTSLRPDSDGGFRLETTAGKLIARTVVLSTGAYQRPHRSPGAASLPSELLQLDVEDYRNPAELPPGRVLVVGSGQSGCQIAEELHEAGREVFLACGRAGWAPRRIGDRDLFWWLLETGDLDDPLSSLPTADARPAANVQATGHGGGHDPHYRTLRNMGVTLLGRFLGADGRDARFAPDLVESVAWGDERHARFMDRIRKLAAERGLPPVQIPDPEPFAGEAPETAELEWIRRRHLCGWFSARLRVMGALPGRVRQARIPGSRGRRQHRGARTLLRRCPFPPKAQVVAVDRRG